VQRREYTQRRNRPSILVRAERNCLAG
jgi:hypothetical protein